MTHRGLLVRLLITVVGIGWIVYVITHTHGAAR